MKKILALVLSAMMIFSLAACGNEETPSGSDDPSSSNQEQTDNTDNSGNGDTADNNDTVNNNGGSEKENSGNKTPSDKWPKKGLATKIPEPNFDYTIVGDMDTIFTIVYEDATEDQVRAYVEEVKAVGFTVDEKNIEFNGKFTFQAYNEEGYWISIGLQVMEINPPTE